MCDVRLTDCYMSFPEGGGSSVECIGDYMEISLGCHCTMLLISKSES